MSTLDGGGAGFDDDGLLDGGDSDDETLLAVEGGAAALGSPAIFDLRVRRHEPSGGPLEPIATLDIQATVPYGDLAALRATVTLETVGTLPAVVEAALEYWDGSGWVEPRDARFLIKDQTGNERDPANTRALIGTSLWDWLLRKLIVREGDIALADGKRPFNSATAGAIMQTILDEGQARGWGPFLDYTFTSTHDSAGVPWAQQISIAYQPGRATGLIVLQNLIDQGMVERVTVGRTLNLYNPGHGAHRDEGPAPVRLAAAADSMPVKRTLDDLVTDLTFYGEDGFVLEVENSGAYAGLGRLETAVVQGGVSDEGTATLLGQAELTKGKQVREEITASEVAAAAEFLPWIDYQIGDWVQGRRGSGEWEALRVQEVTLTKNAEGTVTVSPTLNDRFLDLLARMAKRTIGILGGATAGGSGSVPNTGEDNRQPKAPVNVSAASSGYWDSNGVMQSQLQLAWDPVTEALNDVAIAVRGYEVWGRKDDGESPWQAITTSDTAGATASPFEPLTEWLFKVRAQSHNGVWGPFSDEEPVTMGVGDPALDQPTAPLLTSAGGVVVVTWDGRFDTDPPSTAPVQFMQMDIEMAGAEAGPYELVGTLTTGRERQAFTGLIVGSTPWFRFVAVDRRGRRTTPSEAAGIEVVGIDGVQIIGGTIYGDRLVAGSVEVTALVATAGQDLNLESNASIVLIAGQVEEAVETADGAAAGLADMRLYVQITEEEVAITRPGSPSAFALSNERIEARQSGIVVSYWEAGQLNVPKLVTPSAQIGNHLLEAVAVGTVMRALVAPEE